MREPSCLLTPVQNSSDSAVKLDAGPTSVAAHTNPDSGSARPCQSVDRVQGDESAHLIAPVPSAGVRVVDDR